MAKPIPILGDPSDRATSALLHWQARSKVMALGWTVMRVWLGVEWLQSGVDKLWGPENLTFLHNGAPAVAGYASSGLGAPNW